MTALLALDTHPFVPEPGAEWAEPLWSAAGADVIGCRSLPIVETDEELGDLVAVVAELSRSSESVLVLYPVARQARVEALMRILRPVSPVPLARVATRLPPLSAAVLALLLRRLGGRPGWDAGRLAAAVPLLEQQLTTVGWVRRIGRPIRAAATPGTAGRRFGPGWFSVNGFEIRVDAGPAGGLEIRAHRGVPVPVPAGQLAYTAGNRGDGERLSPVPPTTVSVRPATVSAGSPGEAARAWFSTSRSAEMVFLETSLAALTDGVERGLAARVQVRPCDWCQLETPSGPAAVAGCAFCAHHPGGAAGSERRPEQPVPAGRW